MGNRGVSFCKVSKPIRCQYGFDFHRHLAKEVRCFTLFATHFHEIAELSSSTPTVKSYYMDAAVEKGQFTLLYRLKPGVIERSFGIHVAKLADFPQHLVEVGDHYLSKGFYSIQR